jgi:hypothetical protein
MSSARSIGLLNHKCRELGLPLERCHRRMAYRDDGPDRFMSPARLGWYGRSTTGGPELFLGSTYDDALHALERMSEVNPDG